MIDRLRAQTAPQLAAILAAVDADPGGGTGSASAGGPGSGFLLGSRQKLPGIRHP